MGRLVPFFPILSPPQRVSLSPGPLPPRLREGDQQEQQGLVVPGHQGSLHEPGGRGEGRRDRRGRRDRGGSPSSPEARGLPGSRVRGRGLSMRGGARTHARTHTRTALHARHTFPSRGRRFVMMRRVSTIDDIKPRAGLQLALLEKKPSAPSPAPFSSTGCWPSRQACPRPA